MANRHLAHQLRRQFVKSQRLAALNDQWQKIKSRRTRRRSPAERHGNPRELEVHRITENAAIRRFVRGVSNELVVPNANLIFNAAPRRHYRHQRHDPPIAGRTFQMLAGGLENFVGRRELAGIDYLQRLPMQPTDAAHGIAPRLTTSLLQRDIRGSGGLEQLRRIDEIPTLGMMAMQRASGSSWRVRVIHDGITAPITRRNGFRKKRETPRWQAERTLLRCGEKTRRLQMWSVDKQGLEQSLWRCCAASFRMLRLPALQSIPRHFFTQCFPTKIILRSCSTKPEW